MKRNGMCPICFLKKLFKKHSSPSELVLDKPYSNGAAQTPPMGWSSWNTFKNHIDENLVLETARAMQEKGLVAAGYNHINLDDCWHSSLRDADGNLQADLTSFPHGIPSLVTECNKLGLKVGIYSSNGTLTCEDLPASLGNEERDALTIARWGIEFFKYDFCHNELISRYAPLVESVTTTPSGEFGGVNISCAQALLYGSAKLMPDEHTPSGYHVSGLDDGGGKMEFNNIFAEADGDYVLTINVRKKGEYKKFLMAVVNGSDKYFFDFPPQKFWNYTAKFQQVVRLKKGINTLALSNPVHTNADSAMLQYYIMGQALAKASATVAQENATAEKPIIFSICEWGKNKPYLWGKFAGNMWRTTGDIMAWWPRVMNIYESTVGLWKYADKGHWNDPDMLEVGNGKLTDNQNKSHFALWCMLNSPLILGNDIRNMSDEVQKIVTNANLIAINQDSLGKQAKRIKTGLVDILAKPLDGGKVAVCVFNKGATANEFNLQIATLCADEYLNLAKANTYCAVDQYTGKSENCSLLK
ncbi:MAG: alpha-galactosidase, partial [Clostridia bacterium]